MFVHPKILRKKFGQLLKIWIKDKRNLRSRDNTNFDSATFILSSRMSVCSVSQMITNQYKITLPIQVCTAERNMHIRTSHS